MEYLAINKDNFLKSLCIEGKFLLARIAKTDATGVIPSTIRVFYYSLTFCYLNHDILFNGVEDLWKIAEKEAVEYSLTHILYEKEANWTGRAANLL